MTSRAAKRGAWPAWLLVLAMMALTHATAAGPDRTDAVFFDIPAQTIPGALVEFAKQAGEQLFFISNGFENTLANEVAGTFSAQAALDLLLAGTGLTARISAEGGIEVKPVRLPTPGDARHPGRSEEGATGGDGDAGQARVLEEVVVTGSQIRGTAPVGARVITLDRDYIELSNLASTQELIQTVPQHFGAGANEANATVGLDAGSLNFGFSSSVNLRGLGTDSTLVLLNGRRSAASGGAGGFVDLNTVPVSAIERIEVLPDGASAIYGSDAVGGVVNVVLRQGYEGVASQLRYSPRINDVGETRFNVTFGNSWASGNVLIGYEHYDRGRLRAEDRDYTSSSDLTRFGGTNHDGQGGNPGNIVRYTLADGSRRSVLLPIPHGQDGTSLAPGDLVSGPANRQNRRRGSTVLPDQVRDSAIVALSQSPITGVELFAELRYSARRFESHGFAEASYNLTVPATNPFFVDPFGGSHDLSVDYSFVDDYGARRRSGTVDALGSALGATLDLSRSWKLEVYGSQSRERTVSNSDRFPNTALLQAALADPDPATAFNPFGDGSHTNPATLAAVEGFRNTDIDSELTVLRVIADGELFETQGGAAKLALGAQLRDERLRFDELLFTSTLEPVPNDAANFFLDRGVAAAFIEFFLPVVGDHNRLPGVRRLQVSAAARYENYSDFGATFDPKFGVTWSPLAGLSLRATAGTSFRAPLLQETNVSEFVLLLPTVGAGGTANAVFLLGTGGRLRPQEGKTWTIGIDIESPAQSGLRLGLTYFRTAVDGLIQFPADDTVSILREAQQFASIITHCPCDPAALDALFDHPGFSGTRPANEDVAAIVDARLQNISRVALSGVDVDLAYGWESGVGSFDLSLHASRLFHFKRQVADGPRVDYVDTVANPSALKVRSTLTWRSGDFTAAVTTDHVGDYVDNISSPQRHVNSWTTWDLRLACDLDRFSGVLDKAEVSLGIRNLFDSDPPFVDGSTGIGFDSVNSNPLGRQVVLQLSRAW